MGDGCATRQRPLNEFQFGDVAARHDRDPLTDHFGLVLDQTGGGGNDAQGQHAPTPGRAELFRAAQAAQLFADNIFPIKLELADCRAGFWQALAGQPHRRLAQRTGSGVHGFGLDLAQTNAGAGFFERIKAGAFYHERNMPAGAANAKRKFCVIVVWQSVQSALAYVAAWFRDHVGWLNSCLRYVFMTALSLDNFNWSIGPGKPLAVIAGLNVLESQELALEIGGQLKAVCAELGLAYVFKASFDKANRSSIKSYRGPGIEAGLEMLRAVKTQLNVPICTDLHDASQAEAVAAVADIVQIPAFLCRQTDLVVATAKAVAAQGGIIQVKKAQFLAPWDVANIVAKIGEVMPASRIILCERGTSFGYNNLVVDMLGIKQMQALGCPVTIDATHAVQLPGADPRTSGASTGGRRDGVAVIARAAIAAGADGVFLEFHTDPDKALCDGPSCLPISAAKGLLSELKAIHEIVS